MKSILIVDDDKLTRETMARSLMRDYHTSMAGSGSAALDILNGQDIDVILLDLLMPDMNGLELLAKINELELQPSVIFITGHGTVESAVQAMKLGAYDYATKPVNLERLRLLIGKALETRKLREENLLLKNKIKENYSHLSMIGDSPEMRGILEQLEHVSSTSATILIEGESGTGKELIANIIHYNSERAAGPFIKVNCGGFVENLLESELFGHERGAFTGAVATRKGRFELADGGTLFLDEVGDLPLPAQVKLLRFLQEKTFERVGGNKTLKAEARIISATNKNLEELVASGGFREDLFYRLCVVRVKVPPLRKRQVDLDPLIHHFLQYFREIHNRPKAGISRDVLRLMKAHSWPGNVRELMNCIESMVVSATGPNISMAAVPLHLLAGSRMQPLDAGEGGLLVQTEKRLIAKTLWETGGDKVTAAKILGIGLRTLYRKIEKWGL